MAEPLTDFERLHYAMLRLEVLLFWRPAGRLWRRFFRG